MAVLVGVTACAGSPPTTRASELRAPMPEVTLPRLAGGTWSSTSARGSALVVDVWASWCKPCSKGFPKLDALAARRSDVSVIAISIDEDAAAAREFVAQHPLGVPIVQDAEQAVTRPLGVDRLPTVLLVDADGTVRYRIEEPSERDYDDLGALVDRFASSSSTDH